MGNDKRPGEIIVDQPGMTYVITKEYLVLPFTDIVINRSFFFWWTTFVFATTLIGTLVKIYTNWWELAGIWLLTTIYMQNWMIGFPATFIALAIAYFWYTRRQKRIKRQRAAQAHLRKYQDAVINQSEKRG